MQYIMNHVKLFMITYLIFKEGNIHKVELSEYKQIIIPV